MKLKWVAVLVALMMISAAGSVSAQMMGGGMGMHGPGTGSEGRGGMMAGMGKGEHFLRLVHTFDLTDEQRQAIQAIHFNHMKEAVRKTADMQVAKIELREILADEPVKITEAEKKIRAIAGFRADLEIMHLKEKEAIKAQLTPEQREKLQKKILAELHERRAGKGGMGMMHGGKKPGRRLMMYLDDSDDDDDTDHESENDDAAEGSQGH